MATKKQFECSNCGAFGTIIVRGDEYSNDDIVYCPLCSSDIYEDEEDFEEYEDDE